MAINVGYILGDHIDTLRAPFATVNDCRGVTYVNKKHRDQGQENAAAEEGKVVIRVCTQRSTVTQAVLEVGTRCLPWIHVMLRGLIRDSYCIPFPSVLSLTTKLREHNTRF